MPVQATSLDSIDGRAGGDAITAADDDPRAFEQTHVHAVYAAIAPHFAATRHTPWPRAAAFVRAQPRGAVGLDVGCGSGRYMGVAAEAGVLLLGCDRSAALVGLARRGGGGGGEGARRKRGREGKEGGEERQQDEGQELEGGRRRRGGRGKRSATIAERDAQGHEHVQPHEQQHEVLVADSLALPFPDGRADFAICVAVLHHLATRARRQDGIRHLLRCVRPTESPSAVGSSSDSGGDSGTSDSSSTGGRVLLYVWALEQADSRRGWREGGEQDLLVPWVMVGAKAERRENAGDADSNGGGDADQTFQRYYHLYRKGELEEDVVAAGGTVLSSGYERDNWWLVCTSRCEP